MQIPNRALNALVITPYTSLGKLTLFQITFFFFSSLDDIRSWYEEVCLSGSAGEAFDI